MSGLDCRQARLAIGGDPAHVPDAVQAHLAGCAACARFHEETQALEGHLKRALELPLSEFRAPARPPLRRYALAASLLLAVLVGGGAWLFRPAPALAQELVEHVLHEADSWSQQHPLSREQLAQVLADAGVRYDSRFPVVYASPCPFRGHVVPHLVVRTDRGPLTVMLLAHETVSTRVRFSEGGYDGVLLPAARGGVAVLAPQGHDFEADLPAVLAGMR